METKSLPKNVRDAIRLGKLFDKLYDDNRDENMNIVGVQKGYIQVTEQYIGFLHKEYPDIPIIIAKRDGDHECTHQACMLVGSTTFLTIGTVAEFEAVGLKIDE